MRNFVLRSKNRLKARLKHGTARRGFVIKGALFLALALFLSCRLLYLSGRAFKTEEENLINRVVNECIKTAFGSSEGKMTSSREIGDVNESVVDEVRLNTIRGELSLLLSERLEKESVLSVKVPIGSLFLSGIFSGRGPKITQKAFVSSSVRTDLRSSFESGGVNQTLYAMYLDVSVDYECVSPFSRREGNVTTSVLVFSRVIAGEVPSLYPFRADPYK